MENDCYAARLIKKSGKLKRSAIFNLFLIFCILGQLSFTVSARNIIVANDSTKQNNNNLYKALGYTSAYYAGSMFVLSKTWYNDRDRVSFHFYNDNQGYLQVDKLGHSFGAYVYSYIGYNYLLHTGLSRNESLLYGGTLGLLLQTPIEIMDGIYEGYGFSWGDMLANTSGSLLVIGQELIFKEQIIKLKFSYWESEYAKKANGYLGENTINRILKDYNAQTYWLSMPVNKLVFKTTLPDWLNIAFGYSANGMYGEFENITEYKGLAIPQTVRYRQYLLSLDIDWTKIKTNSKFLRIIFKGMTFVKLPFPAIEYNSLGKIKGYWAYY